MNTKEFQGGIERLIGIYGKGITETLVSELLRRYQGLTSEEWQTLVTRVMESSKFSPKLAHFRDLDDEVKERADARAESYCDICSGGWVTKYLVSNGYPYEAVSPCDCSPHLRKGLEDTRKGVRFISRGEFDLLWSQRREDRVAKKAEKALALSTRQAVTIPPLPPGEPDATVGFDEHEDIQDLEREDIQALEREEKAEYAKRVPEDF